MASGRMTGTGVKSQWLRAALSPFPAGKRCPSPKREGLSLCPRSLGTLGLGKWHTGEQCLAAYAGVPWDTHSGENHSQGRSPATPRHHAGRKPPCEEAMGRVREAGQPQAVAAIPERASDRRVQNLCRNLASAMGWLQLHVELQRGTTQSVL